MMKKAFFAVSILVLATVLMSCGDTKETVIIRQPGHVTVDNGKAPAAVVLPEPPAGYKAFTVLDPSWNIAFHGYFKDQEVRWVAAENKGNAKLQRSVRSLLTSNECEAVERSVRQGVPPAFPQSIKVRFPSFSNLDELARAATGIAREQYRSNSVQIGEQELHFANGLEGTLTRQASSNAIRSALSTLGFSAEYSDLASGEVACDLLRGRPVLSVTNHIAIDGKPHSVTTRFDGFIPSF